MWFLVASWVYLKSRVYTEKPNLYHHWKTPYGRKYQPFSLMFCIRSNTSTVFSTVTCCLMNTLNTYYCKSSSEKLYNFKIITFLCFLCIRAFYCENFELFWNFGRFYMLLFFLSCKILVNTNLQTARLSWLLDLFYCVLHLLQIF